MLFILKGNIKFINKVNSLVKKSNKINRIQVHQLIIPKKTTQTHLPSFCKEL